MGGAGKRRLTGLGMLVIAPFFSITAMTAQGDDAPLALMCEYRTDPIGLETPAPRLSWQTSDGQTAWRVRAASSTEKLATGDADLWDSGKVSGCDTFGVEYAGRKPVPSQRVYWQVKTWTAAGESGWSKPATWQWGLLGGEWQAKWISAGSMIPTPCFEKRFTAKAKPVKADLHITGMGYYEATLNGNRVGNRVLDPSPTDYCKTVLYSTYQVEDGIKAGENVLSVLVGHGLYCVRALSHWWFEKAPWKAEPAMIARLELTYPDGSTETVVSDGTWRQVKSPIGYDDFREGEVIGAWDPSLPDYEANVIPAQEGKGPSGRLTAQSHHAAEVVEEFSPVSIRFFSDGVQLVEFPKNISGWVRLAIRGAKKGDVVSVCYDERVNKDFTPVAPSPGNAKDLRKPVDGPDRRRIDCYFDAPASTNVCTVDTGFQTDRIICSGADVEMYEPRFTYNGFQYVVIRGLREPLKMEDIKARFVHTAFPCQAKFECSDPLFNRLMDMTDVAYRSNYTDGFPTDCPHREKNGWMGDASFACEFAQYTYENTSGYEKWLRDIRDAQNEKGDLPGIVPTAGWGFKWGNGPAWDSALPLIAWNLYIYRGNRRILDEVYPVLVRYLAYTATKADKDGLVKHGLGDWVPADRKAMPSTLFTSSCYYMQAQEIASKIAEIKGLKDDAARFAAGAAKTREAINTRLMKAPGVYDNGGQTAQGMALSFGVVPTEHLAAARKRLVEAFAATGGRTQMGVLGMKHSLRALSEACRSDVAYSMIVHPGSPSPADWVRKGGTALWEDWEDGASRNHIMFGDFACWAYQRLAGIRLPDGGTAATPDPAVRAFREILIAPEFIPQLNHVSAEVMSMYGKIVVKWRREAGKVRVDVVVPPNSTARLRLPGMSERKLGAGPYSVEVPVNTVDLVSGRPSPVSFKERMRLACQMWSVREFWVNNPEKGFAETFPKLRAMGYEGVQSMAFWKVDPDRLERLLDENGLALADMPVTFAHVEGTNLQSTVAFCRRFDVGFVYIPWFKGKTSADWRAFCKRLAEAGRRLAPHGIRIGYHNHLHEFTDQLQREFPAEILAEDREINLELDIGPVVESGRDAPTWIRNLSGRIPGVHAKPYGASAAGAPGDVQKWPEVLAAARKAGVKWFVVECEKRKDTYEDVAASAEYFRKIWNDPPPAVKEPRVVLNLVNFLRGCEPRRPMDLVTPVLEQIKCNRRYGFKSTILMQYDAMIREDMMAAVATADMSDTELGLWFEVVKPLCDAVGVEWRGRNGWAWDWWVCPGFLESYTIDQRAKLIDEQFRLFKERFGRYPVSVGSWILDAWSVNYMKEKYGIGAVCVCREQDVTDAYGLRGGYSNGAYYPSKVNMLSAASDMSNAIKVPVFKMLTPDPIYNYGFKYEYTDTRTGRTKRHVVTLEPAGLGKEPYIVDWYFRTYTERRGLLNLSYMQTGQENSFGWRNYGVNIGYHGQLEELKRYVEKGLVEVETLGETGRRFAAEHKSNCAQTQVALDDWLGKGRRSVWYNCGNYRANLFQEDGRFYIRDIHKMCDAFAEDNLTTATTNWNKLLFTPPVVDAYLFRTNDAPGMLAFTGAATGMRPRATGENELEVTCAYEDGTTTLVRFDENGITVFGMPLEIAMNDEWRKNHTFRDGCMDLVFQGFRYSVGVHGKLTPTGKGYRIEPDKGRIRFDMSVR